LVNFSARLDARVEGIHPEGAKLRPGHFLGRDLPRGGQRLQVIHAHPLAIRSDYEIVSDQVMGSYWRL
jgi:hypothetical protein